MYLTSNDIDDLSRGAAFLGTGGGGDPHIGALMVKEAIKRHGPVKLVQLAELGDDEVVLPAAMMGAPSVMMEKVPRGTESLVAFEALERRCNVTADYTMPVECGGINSMIPLYVAALRGIPVVDADGQGRAFPELQMETFAVHGVHGSPMALASESDEVFLIDTGADDVRMEWFARGLAIRMGGMALLSSYPMRGRQAKASAIPGCVSLSIAIGKLLVEATHEISRIETQLRELFAPTTYGEVHQVFEGKVTDVERRTVGGFTQGSAALLGPESELLIEFQNENVVARRAGQPVAMVPDLICVVEADTLVPITAERLRYGQRVRVFVVGAPAQLRTPAALELMGPRAFGLDFDYLPIEKAVAV